MSKMKNTGIPWLPELAENFSVAFVKQYFMISKDLSNEGEPERVLKLARAGIVEKDVTTNEGQMAASYERYNKVQVGDLLLNPMDLYSGANCNVSELDGVISPAYSNLRAKHPGTVVPKFFDYYFKSQYWLMAMFAHGKGVSFDNRWTLNNDALKTYEIPMIPFDLQHKIAAQIQFEENKVNTLIANIEAQIEKLKAYKQSLITEVVTKGLDPTVPMKDSGVDWIGDIPEHWELLKLKYITSISRGLFNHRPRNDPQYYDGAYPFIQTGDVARAGKYITTYSQTLNELGKGVSKEFPKGTMTMTVAANVGDVAILGFDAYFPDSVVGFTVKPEFDENYVYYLFRALKESFVRASIVSTQLNLNIERSKEIQVSVTYDIDEQKQLAAFLEEKCSQIDRLIAIKQEKIEKLNQYKKSLIYEYVTGKKEVS